MGEALAKAVGQPIIEMWHDSCVYCCAALDSSRDCGACTCHCQTHAAEASHEEYEIEIHEDIK